MNTKEELQKDKELKAICEKIIEYKFGPTDYKLDDLFYQINDFAYNIKSLLKQDITEQLTKLFDTKIKLNKLFRLSEETMRKEKIRQEKLGLDIKDLQEWGRDSNAYNQKVQQAIDIEKERLEQKYINLVFERLLALEMKIKNTKDEN